MPYAIRPHSHCRCCFKALGANNTHTRPDGFCDAICFAAATTLSEQALEIWRDTAWKLDLSPLARAVT